MPNKKNEEGEMMPRRKVGRSGRGRAGGRGQNYQSGLPALHTASQIFYHIKPPML